MKVFRILTVILGVCLLAAAAVAQTAATARISGLVTDANGAVVAGATVKLTDKTTKEERSAVTNDEGRYAFPNITPGTYDLTITQQGFRTALFADVKAEVATALVRDAVLATGSVNETVTITASGEVLLKTEDATVGGAFEQQRIEKLPIFNRGAVTGTLLALQPAVSLSGESAGSRGDQNTFTLDGLDVSDQVGFRGSAGTVVPVPAESVEEFRATISNPTASFGRSGGAQVTMLTKRGGNEFHGALYWYHQNDNLNANTWGRNRLGQRDPEAKDNRFGGSVSGPIWKDRTFFFFNYEGRRVPGSQTVSRTVPTASLRNGVLRFADATGVIRDYSPSTFDPRGIGANPGILAYLRRFPLPNVAGANPNVGTFTTQIPTTVEDDFHVLRLDHRINSRWSLEARGSMYVLKQLTAGQANILELKPGAAQTQRPKNLTVGLTGTIRSNFVNEARYGRAYDHFVLTVINPTTIAGFNVPVDIAGIDELIDLDTQRARIQSLGGDTVQYVDNATWTKGKHTFQFGGTLRDIKTYHLRNDKVLGSLSFPVTAVGNTTGAIAIPPTERPTACGGAVTTNCLPTAQAGTWNTLYSSLLGLIDNTGYLATRDATLQPNPVGTPLINNAKLRHWEFYFADTWRFKPSITFSYGVQYQWHTPPKDELDRQTLLAYASSGELIDPVDYLKQKAAAAEAGTIFNPDIAYIPVKAAGKDVFKINRLGFSPRVSIAWQPTTGGGFLGWLFGEGRKTVFRGGYALLFDRLNTVSSVVVPMLGVGFAQTISLRAPTINIGGTNFIRRVGIDGPIQVPANFAVSSPVIPTKPFGETLSFSMDPNIGDPYNHSVDFTVQREISRDFMLEVGYIGRFARNLYQNLNLNSAPYFFRDRTSGQRFSEAFDAVANQLRAGVAPGAVTPQPWFTNQLPGLGANPTASLAASQSANFINGNLNNLWNTFIDLVAPAPFNNIQSLDLFVRTSNGRSRYDAMFISLQKRMSRGFAFDMNYTLSRSLDQIGGIQNFVSQLSSSFDTDIDWGPSDFDRLHNLNANFVYELPFGKGRRFDPDGWDKLIGGW
jgi:hypothetical protein